MCGVFGIFGHPEAANMAYLGLHALQHRGQEAAGIVSSDGEKLYAHRAMGLGRLPHKGGVAHVVASEPTAFELIGAEYVRDVAPGEMLIITESGMRSLSPLPARPAKPCIFEYVYFARPDSQLGGASVYE